MREWGKGGGRGNFENGRLWSVWGAALGGLILPFVSIPWVVCVFSSFSKINKKLGLGGTLEKWRWRFTL